MKLVLDLSEISKFARSVNLDLDMRDSVNYIKQKFVSKLICKNIFEENIVVGGFDRDLKYDVILDKLLSSEIKSLVAQVQKHFKGTKLPLKVQVIYGFVNPLEEITVYLDQIGWEKFNENLTSAFSKGVDTMVDTVIGELATAQTEVAVSLLIKDFGASFLMLFCKTVDKCINKEKL